MSQELENMDIDLEFNEEDENRNEVEDSKIKSDEVKETSSGEEEQESGEASTEDEVVNNLMDDEEDGGNGSEDDDPVKLFAEFLKMNKVLPEDTEVNSLEDIPKLLVGERDKATKDFINSLPEDIRVLNEAYLRGEDPRNYINEVTSLSDYSKITEDKLEKDENLSKKLIRDYKKELGMSESEIESDIEMYVDAGVISDRAKLYKNKLVETSKKKIEAKKAQQEQARKQFEQQQQQFTKNIDSYLDESEDLFGNVVSDTDKKNIKKTIFEVDESNSSKLQRMIENDPSVLVQIGYLANIGALGKGADFSKLGMNKRREVVKELERATKTKNFSRGNTRKPNKKEADTLQKAAESVKKALEGLKY